MLLASGDTGQIPATLAPRRGRTNVVRLLVRLWVPLVLAAALNAQSNLGSISGLVTDATGALVPGADVSATQTETGTAFQTKTNTSGAFTLPSLPPGRYSVDFKMQGFQTVRKEILLDATQKARLDAELAVGDAVRTVVEVGGAAPVINVESGEIGKTVETRMLRDMPIKGRSVYQVLQLVPGITARAHNTNELDSPGQKYSDSSISGSRPNTNAVTQDGVTTNQATGFSNNPYGALEPIQEVRVLTNAYSAEYGRFSGAQIALQTKSGGQQYHGAAYTFVRNGIFNANRWENNANGYLADGVTPRSPRQDFAWQQIGGAIGGPVPKLANKAFFYVNYENESGTNPTYPSATVPTAEIRSGNFQSLSPYGVTLIDPLTREPFPNNTIPASRLDPVALKIVAAIPLPNAPGALLSTSRSGIPSGNFVAPTFEVRNPVRTLTTRFDTYPNETNRLYLSYQRLDEGPDTNPTPFSNFLNNQRQSRKAVQHRLSTGYTRMFSPTVSNESLVAFQRYTRVELPPNSGTDIGAELGIRNRFSTGLPIINISGLTGFGRNGGGTTIEFPLTFSNYTTAVRAAHTMKFGVAVQRYYFSGLTIPNNVAGSYTFNGDMTSSTRNAAGVLNAGGRGNEAYAFADFLLGAVQTASVDYGLPELARRAYNVGVFINDDWKATRKLTLNLGLRWDYETRIRTKNNLYSRVDPLTGALLVAGRNGVSETLNLSTPKGNFAPRIGLAYALNERTVIRSGFGMFYGTPYAEAAQTTPGFTSAVSIPALGVGVPQPFTLVQGINTPGLAAGVTDPFTVYQRSTVTAPFNASTTLAGNEPLPYNLNWNLSVSRQLPFSSIVEVAYVANRGVHLPQGIPGNAPRLEQAGDVNRAGSQPFRPFPLIGGFDVLHYDGNSHYHSLQSKLSRRFTRGLGVDMVYTFSKMIDSASAGTGATNSRTLGNTQIPWQYLRPYACTHGSLGGRASIRQRAADAEPRRLAVRSRRRLAGERHLQLHDRRAVHHHAGKAEQCAEHTAAERCGSEQSRRACAESRLRQEPRRRQRARVSVSDSVQLQHTDPDLHQPCIAVSAFRRAVDRQPWPQHLPRPRQLEPRREPLSRVPLLREPEHAGSHRIVQRPQPASVPRRGIDRHHEHDIRTRYLDLSAENVSA
jgi:hypothetical protein